MTTTFTGVCGIAGCPDPVDWDIGPGLCHPHWQAFTAYTQWEGTRGNTADDIEAWLNATQPRVSHDN
jgi:hypothetical protein